MIFAPNDVAMTPTHTRRNGKLYRYYVAMTVIKVGPDACPVRRVPAGEIENLVVQQVRAVFRTPELVAATWVRNTAEASGPKEADVRKALDQFDELWDELFPAEQTRIVQLLVERVDVSASGAAIKLRTAGFATLVAELAPEARLETAA